MNKVIVAICIFSITAICSFLYGVAANNLHKEGNMSGKKIMIAYYSHSGNTKAVAEKIKAVTGGDLFEIQPEQAYPVDYDELVNLAKKEKEQNIKPKLIDNGNIREYDIIFTGTPVWWYTMASPVKTFLTENNFEDKIIVPFCTHGGGGASLTYTDMQKLTIGAKVIEGFTSYENSAKIEDIKKWINSLGL